MSAEKKNAISVPKKYLSMSELITRHNVPNLKIASPGTALLQPRGAVRFTPTPLNLSRNISQTGVSTPLRMPSHTMIGKFESFLTYSSDVIFYSIARKL